MRVVHVPYTFHPDGMGGTEVYVEALARIQRQQGVSVVIAAPGPRDTSYEHEACPVRRFASSPRLSNLRAIYGGGDPVAAAAFGRILDADQPDLVHLHAFSSAASALLVRESQKRGVPVVFTYHTPGVSCLRGSLMRWGSEVCDGVLDMRLCAACTLDGLGLGRLTGRMLACVPVSAGRWLGDIGAAGGPWTALRMTELTSGHHTSVRQLLRAVNRIVVVCAWAVDLLVRNGVPREKISLSRHGLTTGRPDASVSPEPLDGPLRVAYLGRLESSKGPDMLVRALRTSRLRDADIRLDIYGIVLGPADEEHFRLIRELAQNDTRIKFRSSVAHEQVIPLLSSYHLLAVPSQCLETGPLVILEAFAAHVPVLGSRLGGIAELVNDSVDGILVEPASPEAWAAALARVVEDRTLLKRLRAGIRAPRSMEDVAPEMLDVYAGVLASTKAPLPAEIVGASRPRRSQPAPEAHPG